MAFVELSHVVEDGMVTYPGLPAPKITTHLTYEASRPNYASGTEFQIGRIDLVANTGTYVDAPAHRFAGAADLAALPLDRLADLPIRLVRPRLGVGAQAVVREDVAGLDVRGRAVLIYTGWDQYWGTESYKKDSPYLTREVANILADGGAALVGIDSLNIDDITDGQRPVHTILLRAGIPVVEHLCGLSSLPPSGGRFFAVPVKVKGMATFPVRAFAIV